MACYIDEDGAVVNVVEYGNSLSFSDIGQPTLTYRELAKAEDNALFSLDAIEGMLPGEFKGFWDT